MPLELRWTTALARQIVEPVEGVRVFELEPVHGVSAYPLGSHIEVQVRSQGRVAVRCYSLVGEQPEHGAYRIAVRKVAESRGGSSYLWGLAPGATLQISEPKSHFLLQPGCPEYLLVAGGIGITPLFGMAQALARRGAHFRLLYAGRARAQMPFVPELSTLLGDRLSVFASGAGETLDLSAELAQLHPDGEVYVCGPIRLMEAARRALHAAGRSPERLRIETFGSSGHRAAVPFEVAVRDHRRALTVSCEQSLLEALSAAGIEVPGHCRRGECGLCAVQVLDVDGEIDHRDVFLSDDERAEQHLLCPCVSRAHGRITIDTGYRSGL
jgi:ferredoxin-NADP reductase